MVIMERENDWFNNTYVVDELQGAGQEKCSSLHTSLILQENIANYSDKGCSVYVAFLDIRKAFDTTWIEGLLYKMIECGINLKTLRLIGESYKQFQCAVIIDGKQGEWFMPERGVHQGSPLSMKIYHFFVNELIQQLKSSPYALVVNGINISVPTILAQ